MIRQNVKDRAQGSAREIKGKIKETAGKVLKNPKLEDKGRGEKIAGKIQRKVGQVEKVFET